MKSICLYPLVLVLSVAVFAESDPVGTLRSKDIELRTAIDYYKKNRTDQRRNKVIDAINGIFDFNIMSARVLPDLLWKQADSVQRNNFTSAFRRMIENSSVNNLDIYLSDSIHYDSVVTEASQVSVASHMWYRGKQTVLVYKMESVEKQWKVYDLVIDELSTLRNYREQFTSILKTKSLEELIEILEKKADSFETRK